MATKCSSVRDSKQTPKVFTCFSRMEWTLSGDRKVYLSQLFLMLLSSYLRLSSVHENDDSAAGNPWFEVIVMVWLLTVSSSFQSWCQSAVAGLVAVSEESCAWIVGRQMCVMGVSVNRLCRPITIFVVTHQMRHLLHMRRDLLIWWEEDNEYITQRRTKSQLSWK